MADGSVVSVVALEIAPGRERDVLALIGQMQGLVRRKGYGTNQLLRDGSHPRRYYDIRIWRNAEAAAKADHDDDVAALRRDLEAHLSSTPLVDVAWAVGIGLTSAGPWQERRSVADRRSGGDRRVRRMTTAPERRIGADRRLGPRRMDEPVPVDVVQAAHIARERAHAAYSTFKVGAAIETAEGRIIAGCNIENATYGLTMCAERVAMFKALSDGYRSFRRIAIVADTVQPTTPCGACRQILWEFAGDIEVVLADLGGVTSRHRLKDLLPHPFDARFLE